MKAWSFTMVGTWETCAAKYDYKYNQKLPDVPTRAASRGTDHHAVVERYLTEDGVPLLPALQPAFTLLERLKNADNLLVEHKIALNDKWEPADWHDSWFRCVLDAAEQPDKGTLQIWEWKTGRKWDNHEDQRKLYGVAALSSYPSEDVQKVQVNGYYIDDHTMEIDIVDRTTAPAIKSEWEDRVMFMQQDKIFAPRPGTYCNWCPYARSKGGPCRFS